ncbi:unnamed protein product [Blepharisma stoltei]|uniref:Uncharacterized protein n=1 Tax=Blepharisma stoltei TaxID=1481888 RepID=A0AAU9J7Q5_9CILI|nr:unnamed protein product [Blepharisma stoltei]
MVDLTEETQNYLGRFNALLDVLQKSESQDDIKEGISKLLYLAPLVGSISNLHYYVEVCKKFMSHTNPNIRALVIQLISLAWPLNEPDSQEILYCFTKDIDPKVRSIALDSIKTINPDFCLPFFDDMSEEVQISAMRCYFRNKRNLNEDYVMHTLSPMVYSKFRTVIIEAFKLIGQLRPSPNSFYQALTTDEKQPANGFLLIMLESEFCEIRLAVLEAISKLLHTVINSHPKEECNSCLYKVIKISLDAINDEFREVRISVFQLLSALTPYFGLRKKPDVDSCIFNLRDADLVLRHAIYEFFCRVRIENGQLALMVLEALFASFQKYPEDTNYIYLVTSQMGKNNYKHGKFLVNKLLGLDKRFLANEHDWNDPIYVAKLIFLVNAHSYDKTLEIPSSCEKHINYISDLYPSYMPQRQISMILDLKFPEEGNSEFASLCKNLVVKLNKMILQPHCYLHDPEVNLKTILYKTCELQHAYRIDMPASFNEFIVKCRIQIHIIYLLSMLSDCYTGRNTPWTLIKNQIENIWKAGSFIKDDKIVKTCYNAINDNENPDTDALYTEFSSFLSVLSYKVHQYINVKKKHAEITFPTGEIAVNECDVLSVQGRGDEDLYCLLEFPDGSLESAKAYSHAMNLNSHIRIHRPNSPVLVQLCFAALFSQSDIQSGPGFFHKTMIMQSHVPISSYTQIMLKP